MDFLNTTQQLHDRMFKVVPLSIFSHIYSITCVRPASATTKVGRLILSAASISLFLIKNQVMDVGLWTRSEFTVLRVKSSAYISCWFLQVTTILGWPHCSHRLKRDRSLQNYSVVFINRKGYNQRINCLKEHQ